MKYFSLAFYILSITALIVLFFLIKTQSQEQGSYIEFKLKPWYQTIQNNETGCEGGTKTKTTITTSRLFGLPLAIEKRVESSQCD